MAAETAPVAVALACAEACGVAVGGGLVAVAVVCAEAAVVVLEEEEEEW